LPKVFIVTENSPKKHTLLPSILDRNVLIFVFLTEICFMMMMMMLWVVVVLEVATSAFESWNKVQVG
jgi:hypothetical protein